MLLAIAFRQGREFLNNLMMRTYEAYESESGCSITLVSTDSNGRDLLEAEATLLYRFDAATGEEASAIHNLRMGWGDYRPVGKSERCPKCEAWFYPEGSGECWRCGKIC
jgi:hypothetical protein